jgi:hypothetical protein
METIYPNNNCNSIRRLLTWFARAREWHENYMVFTFLTLINMVWHALWGETDFEQRIKQRKRGINNLIVQFISNPNKQAQISYIPKSDKTSKDLLNFWVDAKQLIRFFCSLLRWRNHSVDISDSKVPSISRFCVIVFGSDLTIIPRIVSV